MTRVQGGKVFVHLLAPIKAGDGVVFDAGHPEEKEEGGRVYVINVGQASRLSPITQHPNRVTRKGETGRMPVPPCEVLTFGRGDIDFSRVHVGDKVWKTSDPELDRRLRQSFSGDRPHFQRPIQMEVHGHVGRPMTLIARDEIGHVVQVESAMALAKAEKQPLNTERLREKLGRLGGTPFKLGDLKNILEGDVMLPSSELNRLRRKAAGLLDALRAQPKRWTLNAYGTRNAERGMKSAPLLAIPANIPHSEIRNPKLIGASSRRLLRKVSWLSLSAISRSWRPRCAAARKRFTANSRT